MSHSELWFPHFQNRIAVFLTCTVRILKDEAFKGFVWHQKRKIGFFQSSSSQRKTQEAVSTWAVSFLPFVLTAPWFYFPECGKHRGRAELISEGYLPSAWSNAACLTPVSGWRTSDNEKFLSFPEKQLLRTVLFPKSSKRRSHACVFGLAAHRSRGREC